MRVKFLALALASMGWVMGCGSDPTGATPGADAGSDVQISETAPDARQNPVGSGESKTESVGATGGDVAVGEATLEIPAGALPADTAITVTESTTPAPAAYEAESPLYQFAPDGLVFSAPVKIRFAYAGTRDDVVIYWSKKDGPGYDALPTTRVGADLVAEITHFSSGFVGVATAAADAGAPDSAVEDTAVADASTEDAGPAPSDAGAPTDASTSADAGVIVDSGVAIDGGVVIDASAPPDAGPAPADAGPAPSDASTGSDVGTATDAGVADGGIVFPDSGVAVDAGPAPADASTGTDAGVIITDAGTGGGADTGAPPIPVDGGVGAVDAGGGPSGDGGP